MRRAVASLLCCGLLSGCVAAGLTVAGAGAGVGMATGVDHTLSGIVYKTFTAPVNDVRTAAIKTFDRMEIKLAKDQRQDAGWALEGSATGRSIEVELERLTGNTTRMRVTANQGDWFFKDGATATEIVTQTADALERQQSENRRSGASTVTLKGR